MKRFLNFQYAHLTATVWHYLYERRWQLLVFYALIVIANILTSFQPWAIGEVINSLQKNGPDLVRDVVFWMGLYALLMVGFWMFHGPARCLERYMAFSVKRNFYQDFYGKLARLPMSWHVDHHSGNTINRLNKAATNLSDFTESQFLYIESLIRAVMAVGILAFINIYIALVLVAFAAIIIPLLTRFDRILIRETHLYNERDHEFSSSLFDYISNFASVIGFNLVSFTQDKLHKAFTATWPHQRVNILVNEIKWCVASFMIVAIEFIVIVGYVYYLYSSRQMLMIGTVVAVYQYMRQLNQIFYNFAWFYQQIVQYHTNLRAVDPIREDCGRIGIFDDRLPDLRMEAGAIEFKNIGFHYHAENTVFEHLNLKISPREKIGLVGHSGAGKTTLVNLLLRFYEPQAGEILIDGQSLAAVNQQSRRQNIAVIPQDISLFEDTLLENIRFGRLDASDEEVMRAAELANAHEFILVLPDTYNTYVGERGVRLSGGQRQRIAIARAILRDAPILILDEATSALDSHSESLIQDSLRNLMSNKTVIAIAHRLSTIAHLDRLIVMDEGKIIENGTHAELLARNGLYASLWAMQSGGFLGE